MIKIIIMKGGDLMAFWDSDSWSYDDESGYHHNHDENWGFYDGEYGSESDWSDRFSGSESCDFDCDCDY